MKINILHTTFNYICFNSWILYLVINHIKMSIACSKMLFKPFFVKPSRMPEQEITWNNSYLYFPQMKVLLQIWVCQDRKICITFRYIACMFARYTEKRHEFGMIFLGSCRILIFWNCKRGMERVNQWIPLISKTLIHRNCKGLLDCSLIFSTKNTVGLDPDMTHYFHTDLGQSFNE